MSISLSQHPALFAFLLLTAAGIAFWAYRRTVPALSTGPRAFLTVLRFVVFGLLLFLLAEPLLRSIAERAEPSTVALLIDASESMDIDGEDPDGSTDPAQNDRPAGAAGEARRAATAIRGALDTVSWRTFVFGSDADEIPTDLPTDSIRFDRSRTDISRALESVRGQLGENPPSAVVVISDGRYNTGRNPVLTAERFPAPIFTVAVGDTTRQVDLLVSRVVTNELAYRGLELPFDVAVRHSGFGGSRVAVSLVRDGETLDRADVTLPADDGETTLTLRTTPPDAGLFRYSVSVTRLEGERTWRNNVVSTAVRVLDSRKRVLLIASAPSPDLSALRNIIGRDTDLQIETRVQKRPAGYFEGPLPDPGTFDLLILAGFPGSGALPADVAAIDRAAAAGVPVFFLLDRTTDQRLLSGLPNALPVAARVARPGFTEAAFVATVAGQRHPVLELPSPTQPDPLGLLPPVHASDSDWLPSPDAEVLASPRIRSILLPDPLMLVRRRAGHRSMAILAYGFWRWHNLPEALDGASGAWDDIVEGAVRWLSAPEDDRPVRVSPTRRTFDGSEPVRFTGQVYDEAAVPITDAAVEVEVTLPDGRTLPIALEPISNGRYEGDAGQLPNGEYSYRAVARRDGVAIGEDRGSFAVERLTIEFRDTRADAALMAAIAVRSGGQSIAPDGSDLRAALQDLGLTEARIVQTEMSTRLWQIPWFLVAVLVLLTAEWLIRKRKGLV